MEKPNLEELATFCKKKGFVFQAAEIYGGLSGFFDFGPLGVELKNNLKNSYWKHFVHKREDMAGQDGSIITNPKVWKASGHIDNFADLVLTTKETKTKLRADHFIEDKLGIAGDGLTAEDINALIKKHNLKFNDKEDFEEIKAFNLMFNTQVGPSSETSSMAYLRPETCQSIFPNFKLISDVARAKLPFGIVQIGKAFRNEISPRDFVFRCREFEQIEMEYFFNPETKCLMLSKNHENTKFQFLSAEEQEKDTNKIKEITIKELLKSKKIGEYHAYWLAEFFNWFSEMGLSFENMRVREHMKSELSHYSSATFDIDYNFSHGFKEMFGLAYRGNYDLTQHQTHSKSKLEFFDEETKTKLLPHVIEPSLGVERFFMAILTESFTFDKERENNVLKFNPIVAPYKVAVFPLMNKPELTKVAREIYEELIDEDITAFYDKSGSVGKRYARQDEIGTPYCLTIDYEAIEEGKDKGTITIRDRDSMKQKRVKISEIAQTIKNLIKGKEKF